MSGLGPVAMTVDFTCVYGISSAVSGLDIGEQITCFYDGMTILTLHGKRGRVFWFVIQKTDVKYFWPDVPRFTKADAEKLCTSLQHRKIHQAVQFGHIWAHRETYTMTALEENVFEHWNFGRVVCFGDSMHKVSEPSRNLCPSSAGAQHTDSILLDDPKFRPGSQ